MRLRYWTYVRRYFPCFVLGPLFMIISALGEVILPYLIADLINIGVANGDVPYIIRRSLIMALLSVLMLGATVLGANFAIRGASYFAADLRSDIFHRVQEYSFANLDRLTTGSLITRITNDVSQLQTFVQMLLRMTVRSPVMLVGAIVMSFVMNPSLAWVICLVVPLLSLATFLIVRAALPRYDRMQEQLDGMNTRIGEAIANERVIKSFVREDYEIEKFNTVNDRLVGSSLRALGLMIWLQPVFAIAVNVTTLLVVWVAGRQIMVGQMELGTLTAFITYLTQVLTALNALANIFLRASRAAASHRRIREVFSERPDMDDTRAAEPEREVARGEIEFRDVSFRYFKNRPEAVLDRISFRIRAGETVGIIGATGSGKSTLISMIPRLYDVDAGEVLVDGVNVRDYTFKNLRAGIAVVLQQNLLFSGTVEENLRWGREDATREELDRAVEIAQAAEFLGRFPDGYGTVVGQGGVNLSGGQKQRLCIARALLKQPKILILDDSTSALDAATDAALRRAMKSRLQGMTCLVIAQRIASVIDADRILVLDGGRLVGCGTHRELMESCEAYREIYRTQREGADAV